MNMRCVYSMSAAVTLLASYCCVASAAESDAEWLAKLMNIRIIDNDTQVQVPAYMYDLYEDNEVNERYDVIRSIWPTMETFGPSSRLVYDIGGLEPIETVEKVVLHLDSSRPKNEINETIKVSFFSSPKQLEKKKYLGSTTIRNTLELSDILGTNSITDFDQLVVYTQNTINLPMGLVLYSTTPEANRRQRSHDLATLMYKTKMTRRRKRSLFDNEIDINPKHLSDEFKQKKKKNKKKKNKTLKASKLRAVDAGDSIVFTSRKPCQLEKLMLKFEDIGWEDWVIYPKGFETNFCSGGCIFPLDRGSSPTNHATVQSLARSYGRMPEIPEPACVPSMLAPVTLLYMDRSNHVLLKSYPDMRVLSCACN